ncbi:MAG: hypothetical protein FJ206_14220 [Gemmatimonadetes bacterium]|nr:hypothetical protein [Gemmatimonadota bacterium]
MAAGLGTLGQSFLDLWHHVDGVEAKRTDPAGPSAALRPFDRNEFRQHAAGCRAIESAVLDLELTELDDEIDRTILLAAIRPRIKAWERDHPGKRLPTFWTGRLLAVLAERPGQDGALESIPNWVDAGRAMVSAPPAVATQVALDDLAAARTQVERPEWWQAHKDRLAAAAAAIDRFDSFLRHEVTPDPDPAGPQLDEESMAWQLHHGALIEVGTAEALRRLRRRADDRDDSGTGDTDLFGAATAYRQALGSRQSEVRRRIGQPSWLAGFALFVAEATDPGARGSLVRWCRRGLVDASYQLGQLSPAELIGNRDVPAAIRRPLEALETALIALEWEAVQGRFGGEAASLVTAAMGHGLLHPALAAWRLGLG